MAPRQVGGRLQKRLTQRKQHRGEVCKESVGRRNSGIHDGLGPLRVGLECGGEPRDHRLPRGLRKQKQWRASGKLGLLDSRALYPHERFVARLRRGLVTLQNSTIMLSSIRGIFWGFLLESTGQPGEYPLCRGLRTRHESLGLKSPQASDSAIHVFRLGFSPKP